MVQFLRQGQMKGFPGPGEAAAQAPLGKPQEVDHRGKGLSQSVLHPVKSLEGQGVPLPDRQPFIPLSPYFNFYALFTRYTYNSPSRERESMNAEKSQEIMERPKEVLYAFWLTISSLALGVTAFPLRYEVVKAQLLVFTIIGFVLTLAFTLFIFLMILRGRNWARLLYLILFICGAPFAFPAILTAFQKSPVLAVIRLLQLSLQLMAVVLLLQKSTRDWFKVLKLRKLMNYQPT